MKEKESESFKRLKNLHKKLYHASHSKELDSNDVQNLLFQVQNEETEKENGKKRDGDESREISG